MFYFEYLKGNCIWTSSSGKRVRLTNTKLLDLSDVERKSLHRVAIQKLSEILKSCKVPVSVPVDLSETSNKANSKPQKRRAPLLMKRKALTTSFFDSSKSKDSSEYNDSENTIHLRSFETNDFPTSQVELVKVVWYLD